MTDMRAQTVSPLFHEDGWQAAALCRGADSALFFSPGTNEPKEEKDAREAVAKSICRECPVRTACLEFAIMTREPYGIWGGLNESERRRMLSRRAG